MKKIKKILAVMLSLVLNLMSFEVNASGLMSEVIDFSNYIKIKDVGSVNIANNGINFNNLNMTGDYVIKLTYKQGATVGSGVSYGYVGFFAGGNCFMVSPVGKVVREVSYNETPYNPSNATNGSWADKSAQRTGSGNTESFAWNKADSSMNISEWYSNDNTTKYDVYISKTDGVMTFGIKNNTGDSYNWFNTKYLSQLEENDFLIRNFSTGGTLSVENLEVYSKKTGIIASVSGEQSAKAGSEICISLKFSANGYEDCDITACLVGDETINVGELSCTASAENDTIKVILPSDLLFSTTYEVDLSNVRAQYELNGITYTDELAGTTISITTNNGEKELALADANAAQTNQEMVDSLESFNEFDDQDACIDFFDDIYLTNVQSDSEKLLIRKNKVAQKVIEYRESIGGFKEYDFSEIKDAVETAVVALKIESYFNVDEVTEDMLNIFTNAEFYDTAEKKMSCSTLITELIKDSSCETVEELKVLEKKAYSIMKISLISDTQEIVNIFSNTTDYDFTGLIDLNNEDYKANTLAVVEKLIGFRDEDFTYYTTETLTNDFNVSVGIVAVDVAETRLAVTEAINTYGEGVLGLDLSEYKKFDPNLVNVKLVDGSFNTVKDIQDAINERIAELKRAASNTTSGSSSNKNKNTGGGGGGGTIAPSRKDLIPQTEKDEEKKPEGEAFTDIDDVEWAKEAIVTLHKQGKINGVSAGVFEPNRNITRAEFSKLIVEIYDLKNDGNAEFEDVNKNDWFYDYVSAIATSGVATGNDNNDFMPNENLTRQDMAVMVYRLLKKQGIGIDVVNNVSAEQFEDYVSISEYAKEAVNYLFSGNIVNGTGDNRFSPLSYTTRAQATVLLYRIMGQ